MKTLLGTEIDESKIQGVLYICDYEPLIPRLKVLHELLFESASDAIMAYAEIPNPASQIATVSEAFALSYKLTRLHERMQNVKWLEELADYL